MASRNLGDETFMSADDLRNYMTEMQMAKATKSVDGMDRAEKARQELIKRLAEPHRSHARAIEGDPANRCGQSCERRRNADRPN